MGLFNFFSLV